MPPRRYKDLSECRDLIREYCEELADSTSDDDSNMRDSASTQRYLQDLRWFDGWLDEREIESPADIETRDGAKLMRSLSDEFSGTTGRYRWDRIFAFYDWMVAIDILDSNPLTYHDEKKSSRGLSKDTQQSQEMGDDERYALSESEIRQMEENAGNPTLRNTLLIRLMWQTGLRRSEVSALTLDDVVRDSREITISSDVSKSDEERIVGYQRSLDGLLASWIDKGRRDQWVSGDGNIEHLFVSTHGNQLAPESINEVVRKAAINADINRKLDYEPANGGSRWKITAHSIRHGFGSHMVHKTDATLFEVSQMMGHSSVSVTEDTYIEHEPDAGLDSHKKFGPD